MDNIPLHAKTLDKALHKLKLCNYSDKKRVEEVIALIQKAIVKGEENA